jgi:hypothetical protein
MDASHPLVVCRQIPAGKRGSLFTFFAWTDQLKRMGASVTLSAIARNRLPPKDGRQRAVARQHIHRASQAHVARKVRLPACVGDRWPATTSVRPCYNRRRPRCPHDSRSPTVISWYHTQIMKTNNLEGVTAKSHPVLFKYCDEVQCLIPPNCAIL